jgi:hypothetical protein
MYISIKNITTLTMIQTQIQSLKTITITYLVLGTKADGEKICKTIEREFVVPIFENEQQMYLFAIQKRADVREEFLKKGAVVSVYTVSPNLKLSHE